jgi:hypothetical protein
MNSRTQNFLSLFVILSLFSMSSKAMSQNLPETQSAALKENLRQNFSLETVQKSTLTYLACVAKQYPSQDFHGRQALSSLEPQERQASFESLNASIRAEIIDNFRSQAHNRSLFQSGENIDSLVQKEPVPEDSQDLCFLEWKKLVATYQRVSHEDEQETAHRVKCPSFDFDDFASGTKASIRGRWMKKDCDKSSGSKEEKSNRRARYRGHQVDGES